MNMHIQTLLWLNKKLDEIHSKSIAYGNMLLSAIDRNSADFFNKKLAELEKEHEIITRRLWKEKEIIEFNHE